MRFPEPFPYSRRFFLQRGLTLASLAATVPSFIERSALALALPAGVSPGAASGVLEDRILVVIQLSGGNDGLNTVVPYGMDEYYEARPQLAVSRPGTTGGALALSGSSEVGLHPGLAPLKELFDQGSVSIVQGVGYPNPNRSHFTSMDIWHTARATGKGDGWLGRYFDCTCNGQPTPDAAIAIGAQAPPALMGSIQQPVAFENERLFQWLGGAGDPDLLSGYTSANRAGVVGGVAEDSQAGFLMRTALDAQLSSDRIRRAVSRSSLTRYPGDQLARQLQTISALIRDGMPTRVYYATLGGFDTHAGQSGSHASLMRQLAEAVKAFTEDLRAQGNADRVLTMCFSEFGRRVKQNASGGTDHGTAAPMILVGPMVRGGLSGTHPSLTDLDGGDLKFGTDFRSVYAAVLGDWMGADPAKILDGHSERCAILRRSA